MVVDKADVLRYRRQEASVDDLTNNSTADTSSEIDVIPTVGRADGRLEMLSTDCAIGWASVNEDASFANVVATLDGKVLGANLANIVREDLEFESRRSGGATAGRAFVIAYEKPIAPSVVSRVTVSVIETGGALQRRKALRVEDHAPMRVFVMGSPRSGTSQLGATLASCLSLPWTGEAHVAARFALAADQMGGDARSPNEFVRALDSWRFRRHAIQAARTGYFNMHSSSSFLDKTPGIGMVQAAPFMAECFPDSKFVFIRRHPISNIMSRMARFGGSFEEHCNDWAATMKEWARVRHQLPNYLELEQENMATAPDDVALALAAYLGRPEMAHAVGLSLSSNFLESTGAGGGRKSFSQTTWSDEQRDRFTSICDMTMRDFGYNLKES